MKIDFSKLVPCRTIQGEDAEETRELNEMAREAKDFLSSFPWCREVSECYFGAGIGGVVAVFLFRIEPLRDDIDEWLWTIVGDLPSAYLVTEAEPDPPSALEAYVQEMRKWVNAVKKSEGVEQLIPVNVPPTKANAQNLEQRLDFLEAKVLPKFRNQR